MNASARKGTAVSLIPNATLPARTRAYVHMNKIGFRVIAHAASLQGQGRIANLGSRDSRNANIDGFRFHVLAVQRNPWSVFAEIAVALRGTIATYNVNLAVGAA